MLCGLLFSPFFFFFLLLFFPLQHFTYLEVIAFNQHFSSFLMRMSCGTVSNSLLKSRHSMSTAFLSSTKLVILSVKEMRLVQHDLFLMSPCCLILTSYFPPDACKLSTLLIVLAIYQVLRNTNLSVAKVSSNSMKITACLEHIVNRDL